MNEDRAKVLLKQSGLTTTENFTDVLMEKIEAKSAVRVQLAFTSIKKALFFIAAILLLLSIYIFYSRFSSFSEIVIIGDLHRTKLFAVLLITVLLAVNYLLKMQHIYNNYSDDVTSTA
ncbi:hypothetical protein [Portibacter marinus]|uniref:hypothetical protein n=1 Tax=Portibacter marinus TaxID=2898660 RepID=UPI001F30CA5A|nr:hypothetical protein [Portibacter marinus]